MALAELLEEQTNTRMNPASDNLSILAAVERAIEASLKEKAAEFASHQIEIYQRQLRAHLISCATEIAFSVRSKIKAEVFSVGDTIKIEIRIAIPDATKR